MNPSPVLPEEEEKTSTEAPEAHADAPRSADIATGILGLAAIFAVFCACLFLGGGLVYGSLRDIPLAMPFRETATLMPTGTHTPPPLPTPLPTRTPTPTPTRTTTPILPATADSDLQTSPFGAGPWLIIAAPDGLWALSYDAYQLVQLETTPVMAPARLETGLSPSGGHLAYILPSDLQNPDGLTLVILHLPDGKRKATIPLMAGGSSSSKNTLSEARRAILSLNSLTWSPDGRWLAFTGMQDNSSTDIYIYSLDDGGITRLTTGAGYEIFPAWSPDSTWLIYQTASAILDNGVAEVKAVQVVNAHNGAVQSLYQTNSQGEHVAGWLEPNTAILFSRQLECGGTALQSIKMTSAVSDSLFKGCFSDVLYEEKERTVYFSVSAELARDCPCRSAGQEPGLFMLPAGLGLPQKVSSESILELRAPTGYDGFFARTEAGWTAAFTPKGEKQDIPAAVRGLLVAADPASGKQAWSSVEGRGGLGLWVGAESETPRRIFAGSPTQPRWAPGGETLIFFSGSTLYAAFLPAFSPNELTAFPDGALQSAWLQP
ncbi:MAG: PD40 domain-containing protein [Anaerolineaceae bacterium]|nr:PD40 domain-containing protein [Anaerolineaceae bacterium]